MSGVNELTAGIAAVLAALTGLGAMLLRWHNTLRRQMKETAKQLGEVSPPGDPTPATLRQVVESIDATIQSDRADRDKRQAMLDDRIDELNAALSALSQHVGIRHDEMVTLHARLDRLRETVTGTREHVKAIDRTLQDFADRLQEPIDAGDMRRISDEISRVRSELDRGSRKGGLRDRP